MTDSTRGGRKKGPADAADEATTVGNTVRALQPTVARWSEPPSAPVAPLAPVDTEERVAVSVPTLPTCLLEVFGPRLGRRVDLPPGETHVMGRLDDCDIPVADASVSRRHARIEDTRHGFVLCDLGSTNGTFVDGIGVRQTPLRDGQLLKIGGTVFKIIADDALDARVHLELSRLDRTDGLTQTLTREAFLEVVEQALAAPAPSAVLVLAITDFPALVHRFGLVMADSTLSLVASLIRSRIRREDGLGRVGHASFGLVLTGDDARNADRVAEKLRTHVARSRFRFDDAPAAVQLSTGVAVGVAGRSAESLLAEAVETLPISAHALN